MQVREPFYQFASQAGKYSCNFVAMATWVLGFLTWQVMYFIESAAPGQKFDPGLAGPNSFVSVLVGDFLVLPAINGLITFFYYKVSNLEDTLENTMYARVLSVGGMLQSSISAIIGIVTTVVIYALWFSAKKVDWSIPQPGVLNAGGWYHAIFMAVEIYFVSNFVFSVAYICLSKPKNFNGARPAIKTRRIWLKAISPLIRVLGGIGVTANIFLLALLVDVRHHLIPMVSYSITAIAVLSLISVCVLIVIIGVYRSSLRMFLQDSWTSLLLLIAILGAGGLLLAGILG